MSLAARKPRRPRPALLSVPRLRRAVQWGTLLFVAFVALRHTLVGEEGGVITASWEAYCPMGGLETLYRFGTSGGAFVPHVHLSNVALLVAALGVSLLARNAFCGWVCPMGFIQELVSGVSARAQKRFPRLRRGIKALRPRFAGLARLDRPLRLMKYAVLLWAVGGAAAYGFMVFRDFDPWAALWRLLELSFSFGTVVLAVVLVASLFVERPWCRYACPLGAATGLLGRLSPFFLRREAASCKVCAVCTRSCPMGLPIHEAQTITSADCIGCLGCVSHCPRSGALELKFGVGGRA